MAWKVTEQFASFGKNKKFWAKMSQTILKYIKFGKNCSQKVSKIYAWNFWSFLFSKQIFLRGAQVSYNVVSCIKSVAWNMFTVFVSFRCILMCMQVVYVKCKSVWYELYVVEQNIWHKIIIVVLKRTDVLLLCVWVFKPSKLSFL